MRFGSFFVPLAAAVALTACADGNAPLAPNAAAPARPTIQLAALSRGDRLATIEWEGTTPTLYLQDADGSNRTRVHFEHVHGHVSGNYSSRLLPVTDESILAIHRIKWSPDGRQLAVILRPAFEASQVVVVTADGRDIRTVSPNSQDLYGDVEWSPDSRRIAYTVATGPYGLLPDLFVTDLGPDVVRRVTTNGKLSGYDTYRFDPSGNQLRFTEHVGWASDGINVLSRLGTADLTTGTVSYRDSLVGEPQGFARDGSWALFIRWGGGRAGVRELVKRSLPDGAETILTTGDLWNAVVQEGEREAILVAPDPKSGSGSLTFNLLGLDTPEDFHGAIATPKDAVWAALLQLR